MVPGQSARICDGCGVHFDPAEINELREQFAWRHKNVCGSRLYKPRKNSLNASFRAQRGIPLWFKFKKRGIPRCARNDGVLSFPTTYLAVTKASTDNSALA